MRFRSRLIACAACAACTSAPSNAPDGGGSDASVDASTASDAGSTSDAADATAPRDPALWPFTSDSPWNVPLATTAQYESATGAETSTLLASASKSYVNRTAYSFPVYVAASSDPLATLTYASGYVNGKGGSGSVSIHVPAGAAPSSGTDSSIVIVTPDHQTGWESWQFAGTAPNFTTSYTVEQDLTGTGWGAGVHAAGCSLMGGLIRGWELAALHIPHALAVGIATTQALSPQVWPATSEDSGAKTSYTGTVPMGALVALDPSADVETLATTPEGKALGHALQDYGAYVIDTAGTTTGLGFVVDPEGTTDAQANALRTDVAALASHVRVVTNNAVSTPGGGDTSATRRAPLAPPL